MFSFSGPQSFGAEYCTYHSCNHLFMRYDSSKFEFAILKCLHIVNVVIND